MKLSWKPVKGFKNNNILTNLEWMTNSENQLHAIHKLKVLRGEEIGNSVLTEKLIKEIKKVRKKYNYSYTKLQEIYNINRATIHYAITGRTWKHLL